MTDCIFCKIVKGDIPSSKVYEDDKVLAFLDIGPVHKGHTLVVPKEHFETILDIPEDLLKDMIVVVKKVAAAVKKAMPAEGISVVQSNHKAANQLVPHIHFHIIPRFEADALTTWPQGKYDKDEMQEYTKKIISFVH